MINNYMISIEGVDKSGKDLVGKYIKILGNYKYVLLDRGLLSNIAYSKLYGRNYEYNLEPYKNVVIVYLTVDQADWEIRCKLANEPAIDLVANLHALHDAAMYLDQNGQKVLVYNTSKYTPYCIALDVIKYMNELEENNGQPNTEQNPTV